MAALTRMAFQITPRFSGFPAPVHALAKVIYQEKSTPLPE